MEKSYFFNSRDGNRLYDADSFAEAYKPLFTNGAFNGELQVLADSGMNVKVMPGHAWINGRSYWNTDEKVLTLKVAIGQEKRIDSVVVRLDEIEGEIVAIALKGEEDLDPEPPMLQREAGYYDLRIAEILVRPGVLEIVQADITDTRMDAEKCGWVVGAVEQISFKQMTEQFDSFLKLYKKAKEDEFLDWFGNTEAAKEFAKVAESWAHGGTGVREGEDTNNAKEYARQAKASADKAQEIAGGDFVTKSDITNNLLATEVGTALDAVQGKALDNKGSQIALYVGADNSLHFRDWEGNDSIIPINLVVSDMEYRTVTFSGIGTTRTISTGGRLPMLIAQYSNGDNKKSSLYYNGAIIRQYNISSVSSEGITLQGSWDEEHDFHCYIAYEGAEIEVESVTFGGVGTTRTIALKKKPRLIVQVSSAYGHQGTVAIWCNGMFRGSSGNIKSVTDTELTIGSGWAANYTFDCYIVY